MTGLRVHNVVVLVGGALVFIWIAAHVLPVVFVLGGLLGYLLGRRQGRHRAILDTAKQLVEGRARTLGGLWAPTSTMYPN